MKKHRTMILLVAAMATASSIARDAEFEGNVFVRPEGAPEPCIDVADGVEGLVVSNNRIVR